MSRDQSRAAAQPAAVFRNKPRLSKSACGWSSHGTTSHCPRHHSIRYDFVMLLLPSPFGAAFYLLPTGIAYVTGWGCGQLKGLAWT
jgi:hypothetical protein